MSGYTDAELLEEQYWEDWSEKWMEDRERESLEVCECQETTERMSA